MILVMGATGHVGSKIVQKLLDEKHQVRCVARKFPDKSKYAGAELAIGDANEVSFLSDAMRGCTAAFTLIPPNPSAPEMRFYQNKFGEVIAEAIEESGIKKVVNLSSLGADLVAGTGPVLGLHDQEERLEALSSADIIHLRPAYFMENLFEGIRSIVRFNKYFGLIKANLSMSMIATQDIATRAAFLLSNPDFEGQNFEHLLGERDLTYREIIQILGQAIGKPDLEYVEVSPEDSRKAMMATGISEDWANGFIEMAKALNTGAVSATAKRSPENTTVTSIEEFASTSFLNEYRKFMEYEGRRPEGKPMEHHP